MVREFRDAWRSLIAWRIGAVAATLTLAIGIGTATSMYALVRIALGSIVPQVEDIARLGRVFASSRALGVERSQLQLKDVALLESASSIDAAGAYVTGSDRDVVVDTAPATIGVGEVSAGFFPAMRARAALGRLPSVEEFHSGAPVAVVSDRTWRTQLASRPLADARITIDGVPRAVIGVLPASFGFPFIGVAADVWVPLAVTRVAAEQRVAVLARITPRATWAAAAAELDALGRARDPGGLWTWTVVTAEQDLSTRASGGFAMMFGPAFVILLIGCTNVACMLLARGVHRDTELSVRGALGATRWRIARQLLAEHAALGLAAGSLGLAFAYALVRTIAAAVARFRPDAGLIMPSTQALVVTAFAFSMCACLLFGALPAIRLSRRDIASALKGNTPRASGRFVGYGARDLIVFFEVGIAVGLVVTTAMFVRFFIELERVTPRFAASEIVMTRVPSTGARAAAGRIAALPGISGVTAALEMPGTGRGAAGATLRTANGRNGRATIVGVDASLFRTIGIPLLRGRTFADDEIGARAHVAVLSEAAAATLWPGGDPIGASFTMTTRTGTSNAVVIGVSGNAFEVGGLGRAGLIAPDVYVPADFSAAPEVLLFARAAGDPRVLRRPVSEAARGDAPGRPPRADVVAPAFVHADSLFVVRLFGGFGLLALLLAASGIFGVLSQSVAQRTTEFGVRMAMGASAGQVLRMVLFREGKLIAMATASGIAVTLLITRSAFVEMLVISGTDLRLWVAVGVLCGGAATLAATLATWRIVTLDPWRILRT